MDIYLDNLRRHRDNLQKILIERTGKSLNEYMLTKMNMDEVLNQREYVCQEMIENIKNIEIYNNILKLTNEINEQSLGLEESTLKKIHYIDYNHLANTNEIVEFIKEYDDIKKFGTINEFLTIYTLLIDMCNKPFIYLNEIMSSSFIQIKKDIKYYYKHKDKPRGLYIYYLLGIKDDIDDLLNTLKQIK